MSGHLSAWPKSECFMIKKGAAAMSFTFFLFFINKTLYVWSRDFTLEKMLFI